MVMMEVNLEVKIKTYKKVYKKVDFNIKINYNFNSKNKSKINFNFTHIYFMRSVLIMKKFTNALLVKNEEGKKARVLMFTVNKGGNGKTSSAVSVAGAILKDTPQAKVLIIDTDNQGNVCTSFNIDPDLMNPSITNVLLGECKAEEAIYEVYREEDRFIHILPCNEEAALIEMEIISNPQKYPNPLYRLKEACGHLVDYYDFIIFDTPPAYSLMVAGVLCFDTGATAEVYVPFHPETYSYRSLMKVYKAVTDFQQLHNPKLKFGGVFGTKVDSRTNLHSIMLQTARQFCMGNKVPMLFTTIPHSIRNANSIAYEGVPSTLSRNKTDLVSAYFELWEEIK
jgi:chromosome partitioning protein